MYCYKIKSQLKIVQSLKAVQNNLIFNEILLKLFKTINKIPKRLHISMQVFNEEYYHLKKTLSIEHI